MDRTKIKSICRQIKSRIDGYHIRKFEGHEKELFLISDNYPGIWLEHVYDSLVFAMLDERGKALCENVIELFIKGQKEDGQFPCYVLDKSKWRHDISLVGYSQIQECVSFATLCLETVRLTGNSKLLEKAYSACRAYVGWLKRNRTTLGTGLVEMFVGYDTGHDDSARLDGLSCTGNYVINGTAQNASVLPPNDKVAPVIAVDMNCNFYANLISLSEMAGLLGKDDEAEEWKKRAKQIKDLIFECCFDKEDVFFYDVDKNGNKRKIRSCTVYHLFMEHLLDKVEDAQLIDEIKRRYLKNPDEFFTPFPYPSMSIAQSRDRHHSPSNCWGYFSQGLIALRCTRWMDDYEMSEELDIVCEKWLSAWTECFDTFKLGQELDPITGKPSPSSEWYSSTMLFYLYAAKRLGIDV